MVEQDGLKVEVKKELQVHNPEAIHEAAKAPKQVQQEQDKVSEPSSGDENSHSIKSPMVGTFYVSANPDLKPYLKVGDHVKKGDIVCIIEAMKLFNEIESDCDGVVTKVLVENAKCVEYGQDLFSIRIS